MFDTPDGAKRAVSTLEDMHRERVLSTLEYASVSWDEGDTKPVTDRASPTGSTAGLGGAFWGMLVGLVFFVPLLDAAKGSARGSFTGSMADVGIEDGFIKKLRAKVTPGASALFLMAPGAVFDRVKDRLEARSPSGLVHTHLSEEQDSALRWVFGGSTFASRIPGWSGVRARTPVTGLTTTTLTVCHYDSVMGASADEVRLRDLEQRGELTVIDSICLSWARATPKPRVARSAARPGSACARRGAVLGGLAGTLVRARMAGEGLGTLAGRLRHTGIDEPFLENIASRLVPGTSSLLLLSADLDVDAIRPVLERGRGRGEVTFRHALLRDDATRWLRDLLGLVPSYPSDSPASEDLEPVGSPLPSQRSALSGPSLPRKETP